MSTPTIEHVPVLVGPVMELLAPAAGEVVVDCTLGHGGHAALLAAAAGESGRLIGLDIDAGNMARARRKLGGVGIEGSTSVEDSHRTSSVGIENANEIANSDQFERESGIARIDLVRANFTELAEVLDDLGVGEVDVVLADLGVSTDQLLDASRGLTFGGDAPLDMRLDDRLERSASDLVNALPENALSDLLFFNSQERFSRRIAKRICQVRREGRIRRTSELVRIVCSALGVSPESYPGKIHPATRTFLALRIAVNGELENLAALVEAAPKRLKPGGRIGIISFHSGEDRIVKQKFLDLKRSGGYEVLTKKPIGPDSDEIRRNPRSRSSKLRVAQRLPKDG